MIYTNEEKMRVINRFNEGDSIKALCSAYGVSRSTLYRWIHDSDKFSSDSENIQGLSGRDYHMLQHKIEKLENIIAILKTVNCTIHAPLKEKLSELELLYGQYDVHTLCEALEVSRGTFYNHIFRNKRGDAWFEKRREEYRVLIRDVFNEYRQVLGAEKIRTILMQRGHKVSTRFVADIMREMGLVCVRSTAKQEYLKLREPEKKRNVLQQRFTANKPNKIWVSDITCFKLNGRYYYICVILDLFSRKIISYKISKKNSTQLITSTFRKAWELRSPKAGLLFHSDRGTQYTSHRFQQMLHDYAVVQSFSNSGRPHDNAVAESFFASLKKEELYRRDYTSEPAFKKGIESYIEFYNTRRPHRTLKNRTPCQMEGGSQE